MTADPSPKSPPVSFDALKAKQRAIRDTFPEPLALRTHRALSWLKRAEHETDDPDVRFILLWIGFNSAYASELGADNSGERSAFSVFFNALVDLDKSHRIYDAVWTRFPQEIRVLLNNKYVYSPFWSHQNGHEGYDDWEARLTASHKAIAISMAQRNTTRILAVLFDRLYVLRNQLVHGGATWSGGVNRDQVRDGAAVLASLLPVFIDIMMDNPNRDWGRPFYPVVK